MSSAAIPGKLTKASPVGLRAAGVTESWLQEVIEKDPAILGFGDVIVIDRQRKQERAGRLDLLLEDESGDQRYEVELMLGSTDESHLIRTVEYWDIERRKWPGYEHCGVLIAEDITTRFLNVISLFSGSIPLIVIQVNGLQVEDKFVLNFVKVLDSRSLRTEEGSQIKPKPTDRQYWIEKASIATVEMTDKCLEIINMVAFATRRLSYNKQFIGLNDGIRPGNFVVFKPRKSILKIKFGSLQQADVWAKRLEESGLESNERNGKIRIDLTLKDFEDNHQLLTEMLHQAVKDYEKD